MTAQSRGVDGSAVLASARSIVRPRSATCGAACRAEPCTLRQIRYAERALETDPLLVVWAELGVLAHLVGEPLPVLRAEHLDALASWQPRDRECALSHAVDAAVATRTPTFATRLSPDELAVHVVTAMNDWIDRDRSNCGGQCSRWRIDPGSDSRRGARPPDRRQLLLGLDEPSRLEGAFGCRVGDPAWQPRFTTVLDDFAGCGWPIARLGLSGDHR